jgi:predicted acylesterase/phospholipase RssA
MSLPGILFYGWATNQFEGVLGRPIRFLFTLIASLPAVTFFGWLALILVNSSSLFEKLLCGIWLSALLGSGIVEIFRNQSWLRPAMTGGFAGVFPLLVGEALLQRVPIVHFVRESPFTFSVLVVDSLSPILMIIGFVHGWFNLSFLSNGPLKKVVSKVALQPFKRPLLATTSELIPQYVDPDDFSYRRVGRGPLWVPVDRSGFLARYNRLDTMSKDDAINTLLASAALPLGIIPNVSAKKDKARIVDGGLADNIPWHPFVNEYHCTEIIIVLCEPVEAVERRSLERWKMQERSLKVLKSEFQPPNFNAKTPFSIPSPITTKNDPPTAIPQPMPDDGNDPSLIKFTLIGPAKALGGLISATMNFNSSRALLNMQAGREAARAAIASGLEP